MSRNWPRVGTMSESAQASYELSRIPLGERVKGFLLYGAFILGVIIVMGGIIEVFTPGEKYTKDALDAVKQEYLEEYIEENGEPEERYWDGVTETVDEVFEILERYGVDDPDLLDEIWHLYF